MYEGLSEQEKFESEVDNIVRKVKSGKSILQAYYALDSVKIGTDRETQEYSKPPVVREPVQMRTVRESHDIKILKTVDGTQLVSVDGVLLNYNDVATAIAQFTSD
jgi:hypothetical protein